MLINRSNPLFLLTIIKGILVGALIGEIIYFDFAFVEKLRNYILGLNILFFFLLIGLYFSLIIIYSLLRGFKEELTKLLISKRIDVLGSVICGLFLDYYVGGEGKRVYFFLFSRLSEKELVALFLVPLFTFVLFLLNFIRLRLSNHSLKKNVFFLSDKEEESKEEDLLGYAESSVRFAERVINLGSYESVVFGIDAPWGIGKSSFINFCKEFWKKNYTNEIIIYEFSPLRYESRENLLEKFIDGLITVIQNQTFTPEIKPVVSTYSRVIKSAKTTLFNFLNFELDGSSYTVDEAFSDLESTLFHFEKKIVVIVDDLDRLNISAVKDLLFTVKKSFSLPNVSYVFCYDTENISSLETNKPNLETITEFLEKFINVKISLFLNSDQLLNYLDKNIENSFLLSPNPIFLSQVLGGLKDILRSKEYPQYIRFLGDLRKIKRILNTILVLNLSDVDLENTDINGFDLVHLILIYINYPNVFRKIYNYETANRRGFFSAVTEYDMEPFKPSNKAPSNSESYYQNSKLYDDYIKDIKDEDLKLLLDKVFNVNKRVRSGNSDDVSKESKEATFACFNGTVFSNEKRNLENYLKLIVSASKPPTDKQYKFYLNKKNEILSGDSISKAFSDPELSIEKGEDPHSQLWSVLVNNSRDFEKSIADKLIKYLIKEIKNYSYISEDSNFGLRHDLSIYLTTLLDQSGWIDPSGKHYSNDAEYINEIAEWIFGDGRHKDEGILQNLSVPDRGIMGINDLLAFRLFCSADRRNDFYNLTRALSLHGNEKPPIDGDTRLIAIEEMREISQKCFSIFNEQYLSKNVNIFEIVEKISIKELTGKFTQPLLKEFKENNKNISLFSQILKAQIQGFVIYQLTATEISLGVPCGFYNEKGNGDGRGISEAMNSYLFGVCFNPVSEKNLIYFIDFLLQNLSNNFHLDKRGSVYIPSIVQFTKILDKQRLYSYWKGNSLKIKLVKAFSTNKKIYTSNYTASYKEDIGDLFRELDEFVEEYDSLSH